MNVLGTTYANAHRLGTPCEDRRRKAQRRVLREDAAVDELDIDAEDDGLIVPARIEEDELNEYPTWDTQIPGETRRASAAAALHSGKL